VEYEPTVEGLRAAINHRTVACVSRPEKFFPGSLPIKTIGPARPPPRPPRIRAARCSPAAGHGGR
jgi:hypothetical protein